MGDAMQAKRAKNEAAWLLRSDGQRSQSDEQMSQSQLFVPYNAKVL